MKSLFTRKSLAVVSAFFVATIVTSCHDEEVANIEELSYRHGYEYNFVKTFGEINPNQTWDFSSYAQRNIQYDITRAVGYNPNLPLDTDGKIEIPEQLLSWVQSHVFEHQGSDAVEPGVNGNKRIVDHKYWHAFSFSATNHDVFEFVPFYLGNSECTFQVWMVITDVYGKDEQDDEVVWEGMIWDVYSDVNPIQVRKFDDQDWKNVNASGPGGGHGSTIHNNVRQVRATPITIDLSDEKYHLENNHRYGLYFYVLITNNHPPINTDGDILTSTTHLPQLVCIDPDPEIDALVNGGGYNSLIIAAETSNGTYPGPEGNRIKKGRADFDYNDVMFILTGRIPELYFDECLVKQVIKKRYMIEDLYGFDYDFNDIVVDATENSTRYYVIAEDDGEVVERSITYNNVSYPQVLQEATIVHQCGTLPYQIKVGNFTFGQVTDPTNLDLSKTQLVRAATELGGDVTHTVPAGYNGNEPGIKVVIEDNSWNPDENNIQAFIWTKGSDGEDPDPTASYSYSDRTGMMTPGVWESEPGVWSSIFPTSGEVPYIIALDQNVDWMNELFHIPATWIGGDMTYDAYQIIEVTQISTTGTNP